MITCEIRVYGTLVAIVYARRILPTGSSLDAETRCTYVCEVHESGADKNCRIFDIAGHRYGEGACELIRKILAAYRKKESRR